MYFASSYEGKKLIGGTYKKSRYIEYADDQFTMRVNRTEAEENMGILGPAIRAEVGDVIRIVLHNLTPFRVSIFLHGTSLDASMNGMRIKDDGRV